MANIVVLGAGVIGLQTATILLEVGYAVTVVAQYWPGDTTIKYTSPWAGAIWRSHAPPEDIERCEWDLESYQTWMQIVKEAPEEADKMGLKQFRVVIHSSTPDTPWYAQKVQNFQYFQPSQLSSHGHAFDGVCLNPVTYLDYLHRHTRDLGASFVKLELPISDGLTSALAPLHDLIFPSSQAGDRDVKPAIVINCTGLGAKDLCGDADMFPIRGQTLLARVQPRPAEEVSLHEAEEYVTYIFPRPGTELFVLGGTIDRNSDPTPTPSVSTDIIGRCRKLLAARGQEDVQVEVLAEQVGLRPGRKGGTRIEMEQVALAGGESVNVIHHYGHAGAGYQNSIGSAKKVLRIIQETLN